MRIATYNVNGINGRLPVLLQWLEATQPDVACLQELKSPDERFPEAAIEKAGYGAIWHGQKSWNGVAILARGCKPEETRRGLPGDPDDCHSRYIEAAVERRPGRLPLSAQRQSLAGAEVRLQARLVRAVRGAGQRSWSSSMRRSSSPATTMSSRPTRTPTSPSAGLKDALFSPEAKAAYPRLLEQGWTDAIRKLHPDEPIFTFWDYFRNAWPRDAGIRIDHLLLNKPAAKRLKAAGVDRSVRGLPKASDHAPVWIELE